MPPETNLFPRNRLLNLLPSDEYQRLAVEKIHSQAGTVLYDKSKPPEFAYFPDDAMISLIRDLSGGSGVEVGVVGFDGMLGIDALTDVTMPPYTALIQISGNLQRIPRARLRAEFQRGKKLQRVLLAYVNLFVAQISQTAACNGSHTIEKRLARWLLTSVDRMPDHSSEINLSQEFLARMLGVRVAGVNESMQVIIQRGAVEHSRNSIRIVNRELLENSACECYHAVRVETDRLFAALDGSRG